MNNQANVMAWPHNQHSGLSKQLPYPDMVWIPEGTFAMGSDTHYPEEAPVHSVSVGGFWMDKHTVTNAEFGSFVDATNYVTVAERVPDAKDYPGAQPEMLMAGSVVFHQPKHRVDLRNKYNWWIWVKGANWKHPEGPGSSLRGKTQHPVVHVALEDVEAYLKWAGKALPTEAEWERAARGGIEAAIFCWGDDFAPQGKMMANTWQGEFPIENLATDGFERTAPVGSFPPNAYGLYDMAGNVWQWTADWYQTRHEVKRSCCSGSRSHVAEAENSYDPQGSIRIPRRVLKGGSYLCAPNYCFRYRPAARIPHEIDTGTNHIGFRGVVRSEPGREQRPLAEGSETNKDHPL
jgi:sulfatase modifying factor 1